MQISFFVRNESQDLLEREKNRLQIEKFDSTRYYITSSEVFAWNNLAEVNTSFPKKDQHIHHTVIDLRFQIESLQIISP